MAAPFADALNNVSTTLGVAYTPGSGKLILSGSGRSQFPALASGHYYRVTVARVSVAYNPFIASGDFTIFKVTGVGTDINTGLPTLTGATAIEGTTDQSFAIGDIVEVRITAGTLSDLQAQIAASVYIGALTCSFGFF